MTAMIIALMAAFAALLAVAGRALWARTRRTPVSQPRPWITLGAHDVRSTLPEPIRGLMQDGLLDRTFQDALLPEFLFPGLADVRPWSGGLGDTQHFTRTGLLEPQTDPITGNDANVGTYGKEQWSATMDQYGHAVETNLLQSSMTLASLYLRDVQTLGVNAGQSVNRIARNKLYAAYSGGRTWATAGGSGATTVPVNDVTGFTHTLVNGIPTPVSGSNPLPITIGGEAAEVVGVDEGESELTLASGATWSGDDPVVSDFAPVSFRPGGKDTAVDLTSSDVATFALFRNVVARLRTMNVPTIGGAYTAHIDPTTEAQLFSDDEFRQLSANGIESPVWGNLAIGRFGGIDWVRNNEARVRNNGDIDYHEPIVVGGGAFVAAPFDETGRLLADVPDEPTGDVAMVSVGLEDSPLQVARIVRPPQDRLQQVVSTAWSFVGDFAVPSDSVTGDDSRFKRAVVVQHA